MAWTIMERQRAIQVTINEEWDETDDMSNDVEDIENLLGRILDERIG